MSKSPKYGLPSTESPDEFDRCLQRQSRRAALLLIMTFILITILGFVFGWLLADTLRR